MTQDRKFHLIKLRTGETLFVEFTSADDSFVSFMNPLAIRTETRNTEYGMAESVIGSPWVPYTDMKEHRVPMSMIYYTAPLSRNYERFYGTILLKTHIHDLYEDASERIEEGEHEENVLVEVYHKMEATNEFYANKFGIEPLPLDAIKEKIGDKTKDTVLH